MHEVGPELGVEPGYMSPAYIRATSDIPALIQ